MKNRKFLQAGILALCLIFSGSISTYASAVPDKLVPVGIAVGINLETDGVIIVGFPDDSPAKNAGLTEGDCIISINGINIDNAQTLTDILSSSSGDVSVKIKRNETELTLTVTPERKEDAVKLGVFVRDAMAGIGTITYYDPQTKAYGALGHGISDLRTGTLLPVGGGKILDCTPGQIITGQQGIPGELSGKIDPEKVLGNIEKNTVFGIFGHLDEILSGEALDVAQCSEIKPGPAVLLSGVNGEIQQYTINIAAVYHSGESGREMLIEVNDSDLISLTGGIVRGMSGSPIIQNGKLIGAVTHVLVSDPMKGYAISIETMLSACQNAAESAETAA